LICNIGGAGADLRVAFKHITAGDMNVIPMDRELGDRDIDVYDGGS
jgi:hypothetical protein